MEYSVQKLSAYEVEFAFNIDKEEWLKHIETAYQKNKHQYQIPGFRRGHIPMNVLEKRFGGKQIFFEDATDVAVEKCWAEALSKENLNIVDRPQLDVKEVSEDGLKFIVTVVVAPEVDLKAYTGITVDAEEIKVTDKDVDAYIASELDKHSRMVEVDDRPAENGDTVNIDFSGSVDGVKFEGGTAEKQDLVLGSNSFIPGFEEQVVGMKIGEEKDINVKFPADYASEELKGKDAVFAIKMNSISKKVTPELDDEFVKDVAENDNIATVAEYRADISAKLQKTADERAKNTELDRLFAAIIEANPIELPEVMVTEEVESIVNDMRRNIESRYKGLKFEDYLSYTGATLDQLKDEQKARATDNVKLRLIVEAILKKEAFEPDETAIDAKIGEFAKQIGKTLEEYKSNIDANILNYFKSDAQHDMLVDFLRKNNNFVAKKEEKEVKAKKTTKAKAKKEVVAEESDK